MRQQLQMEGWNEGRECKVAAEFHTALSHLQHVCMIYTQTLPFYIYKQIKGKGEKGWVPYSSLLNAFISTVSLCCDDDCCCCSRIRSMLSKTRSLAILVASPNTVDRIRSKGPHKLRA